MLQEAAGPSVSVTVRLAAQNLSGMKSASDEDEEARVGEGLTRGKVERRRGWHLFVRVWQCTRSSS